MESKKFKAFLAVGVLIVIFVYWRTWQDLTDRLSSCCKEQTCWGCWTGVATGKLNDENPDKFEYPRITGDGEIMLGITLTNNKGYTQFTASVLQKYHKIPGNDIHVYHHASSQYSKDNLRELYGQNVRFIPNDETSRLRDESWRILEYFVNSGYKVLFLINGETIFHESWNNFIKKYIYSDTDGFLSLYHSATNHIYTANCEKMDGDLCEGQVFGTFGVAITHSLAEKVLQKHSMESVELNWTDVFKKEDVRLLYPEKSLVMKIGQTNPGKDNCGENEVAYRFNRCALPEWIKNGIEFYFDRCTNPNEIYDPENSVKEIEKNSRFWTRPAISYSFYGTAVRYTQIAVENAVRVFSIYPGWKIWVYTDWSPPKVFMDKLCEFDVRFINMSGTKIKCRMCWRFLVASEPVKMYAVRDIDSYLLKRGKAAVDEWIASGRKFHTIRDHPNHSRYALNGMWGGVYGDLKGMKELLLSLSDNMNDQYMQDMNFLNQHIWKIIQKSVWQHDSHSLHKFSEDHPFPTKLGPNEPFMGKVVLYPPPKTLEELGPRFP